MPSFPTGVFSYDMSPEEKRAYDLVARRFIANLLSELRNSQYNRYGQNWRRRLQSHRKTNHRSGVAGGIQNTIQTNKTKKRTTGLRKGEHGPHTPEIREENKLSP